MKVILTLALLALALGASCRGPETASAPGPSTRQNPPAQPTERDKFVAALDGIGLDKAPTLGPVYRRFVLASYDKDYPAAWDLINQPSKDALTKELPLKIAALEDASKRMEAELKKPGASAKAREYYTRSIKDQNDLATKLKALNGDGEKYFAFAMEQSTAGLLNVDIMSRMEVAGEKINGGRGVITVNHKEGGVAGEIPFTQENGAWKFDFMETSAP